MRNIGKAICCFVVVGMVCVGNVWAFDDGDFQTWSTIYFSYKVNDDWKITGEEELHWGDDWSDFYYTHTDMGVVYSGIAKWLDLGVNYRQIFEEHGRNFKYENRPHFNATVKGSFEGWDISNRGRLEYRDKENSNDGWRYRNKFKIKTPIKITKFEIRPYIADEIFYDFDKEDLNRNRVYLGVDYKLMKHVSGGLYYLWQTTENSSGNWIDYHVIGSELKFAF